MKYFIKIYFIPMTLIFTLLVFIPNTFANTLKKDAPQQPHLMQHGFILSADDQYGSHLVANGHHSWQSEIRGKLLIENELEYKLYERQKKSSQGQSYFLFQAQNLNLASMRIGDILHGHIIESKIGDYEPKNVIVKLVQFRIEEIIINIPNPFF
jgi:hypothetical protein